MKFGFLGMATGVLLVVCAYITVCLFGPSEIASLGAFVGVVLFWVSVVVSLVEAG